MYRDFMAIIVAGMVGLIPAATAVLTLKPDILFKQQANEDVSQNMRPG